MSEDRANNPARVFKKPESEDVRYAYADGKITESEANDLGTFALPRGPHTKPRIAPPLPTSENEIARRVHKHAGLSQGDW